MSGRRSISNSFVVNTVEDGQSAPYYFQEWYAWSDVAQTQDVTTSPFTEPYSGWQTSIPNQGAYAYLWRKSIRYVYNESTRQYVGETAQYFRMSGTNGTSINTKGSARGIAHTSSEATTLKANPVEGAIVLYDTDVFSDALDKYESGSWEGYNADNGDAYVLESNGHLMQFSTEAGNWLDLGQFQGQNGRTYYTHVAWATNVTYSGSTVTAVEGFVTAKSPNDTTHLWMGVLVDENSGQDSSLATTYTWSYTKGVKGDKGDLVSYTNTLGSITIACNSSGSSKAAGTSVGVITLYVNGSSLPPSMTISVVSKPSSITVVTSGSGIPTGGFSVSWNSGVSMANLQGTLIIRASSTGYSADISIPVMCTKEGDRGKTGRFYYYADVWNASDTTQEFSATDAEAPFFQVGNNYYVYIGDTNFTDKTMSWMYTNFGAPSSSNSNYKIMVTDFKYLIAEAIFGKYAHFGSAIINGDWMISQHGTLGGSASTNYTKFDPAYPSTSVYTNHTVNGTTWLGYNFVPNYAVDLLVGKTYMTSAEVRGTIRADNLYHGITFASRAWDGGNVYTSYKWYCMPASIYGPNGYDAKETQQPYYNNFRTYNYYTEEEIATLSGGAITVPQKHGFLMCVGDNDNVYVLPDSYNRFPTIYLPAPQDVPGKVIDVFGFHYGSQSIPNFVVKNVGNPNGGMTNLIYYDSSENKWKANEESGTAQATVATNAAMRFISTSITTNNVTYWWWLSVPFYQKEWVQN